MEKIKLEHLAPYLPYKLKIKTGLKQRTMTSCERSALAGKTPIYMVINQELKPILRPLKDLIQTKYYNSLVGVSPNFDCERIIKTIDDLKIIPSVSYNYAEVDFLEFITVYNKLFEWHFDVFGLIDKGLAIDINKI